MWDFFFCPKIFKRISHIKLKVSFIGDSFYKTRTSLARAAFYREFLYKPALVLHVLHLIGISFITKRVTCLIRGSHRVSEPSPLSTSYPAGHGWKWKVKNEKKSESIFGPLFFFNFRYNKGGVMGNNNIDIKKCTTNFLWFWYFGEVGEIFKNFQKHPLGESFWKNGVQFVDPRGYFWGHI